MVAAEGKEIEPLLLREQKIALPKSRRRRQMGPLVPGSLLLI